MTPFVFEVSRGQAKTHSELRTPTLLQSDVTIQKEKTKKYIKYFNHLLHQVHQIFQILKKKVYSPKLLRE